MGQHDVVRRSRARLRHLFKNPEKRIAPWRSRVSLNDVPDDILVQIVTLAHAWTKKKPMKYLLQFRHINRRMNDFIVKEGYRLPKVLVPRGMTIQDPGIASVDSEYYCTIFLYGLHGARNCFCMRFDEADKILSHCIIMDRLLVKNLSLNDQLFHMLSKMTYGEGIKVIFENITGSCDGPALTETLKAFLLRLEPDPDMISIEFNGYYGGDIIQQAASELDFKITVVPMSDEAIQQRATEQRDRRAQKRKKPRTG